MYEPVELTRTCYNALNRLLSGTQPSWMQQIKEDSRLLPEIEQPSSNQKALKLKNNWRMWNVLNIWVAC